VSDLETPLPPEADAPAEQPAAAEKPPRDPRRIWVRVVSAAAVVAIVLLVLPVFSTLQPAYYERYPSMRARMDNWRASTHARVPCSGCHVNPGIGGFLEFAARSVPAFYSQLLQGPSSTNLLQVPGRAACQKCHTNYREVSAAGDLRIPHRAHVEVLKIDCPVCHRNLVHSPNALGYNKPEMSMCLSTCHDGKQAKNQCVACHTQKEVPESHHRSDWLRIHPAMARKIDCGKCHAWQPDYCRQCHLQRPASHAGNWKTNHQIRAKAEGTKGCLFCHGAAFCKKCH
jgi:hypothetical protein